MNESPAHTRHARFLIVSNALTVEAVTDAVGISPGATYLRTRLTPTERVWEISRSGDSSTDLTTAIQDLLAVVRSFKEPLLRLKRGSDIQCVFRVVETLVPDESVGPGFSINAEDLALLTDVGAFVDVDLYCSSVDTDA